jgi:hypothetical protein
MPLRRIAVCAPREEPPSERQRRRQERSVRQPHCFRFCFCFRSFCSPVFFGFDGFDGSCARFRGF